MNAPQPELDTLVSSIPFAGVLGVTLERAGPDEARGVLGWRPELCTVAGVLHGGVLMSLADNLGAIVAFFNLPEGATTSTIESKTNFFRAVTSGQVHATAKPLHVGRSTIVVRTELHDDADRLVAHVVQTQSVLGSSASPHG